MTTSPSMHSATYDVTAPVERDNVLRTTGLFALVGGAAWVIDTVTIAVLNRSFDPLDSVFFFIGFMCFILTVTGLAVHLSAGRKGMSRVATAVGAFLATAVVLGVISFAADTLGRHVFSSANIGLHDEWSCFATGLCMLAISGWAIRQSRRR